MTRVYRRRTRKRAANVAQEQWSAAEELRLRELAGKLQVRALARKLTEEFDVPRTSAAVSTRARLLNLSLWWEGYSQNEVAAIFGVTFRTVAHWREDGLLLAQPWEVGRGRGNRNIGTVGQWHISEEALKAFCDDYPWAYAVESMQRGPWRSRAEVAHHADAWVTLQQLATIWQVHTRTVRQWAADGRIPHKRRVAGAGLPKIMVRAADLPGLRAELREQALVNLRNAIALRDQRRKAAA